MNSNIAFRFRFIGFKHAFFYSRSAVQLTSLHLQYMLEVIRSELTTQDIRVMDNFGLDLPLLFKVRKIWSVYSQENF